MVQSARRRFIGGNAPPTQGESLAARAPNLKMKCPSCHAPLEAPQPRCPQCRFSLGKLDLRFGLVPAHSRFFTDRSATLPLGEIKQLRAQLRLFHRKFPQVLLSVFVNDFPAGTSVAEFAFWMANRARFTSADKVRGENCNLLLVLDLTGGEAALTSGYGLEKHVPEQTLQSALDEFTAVQREGGLAAGIRACIDLLTTQLRELAVTAKTTEREKARGVESW
jgi:uncharacterized membrane protein YgcG